MKRMMTRNPSDRILGVCVLLSLLVPATLARGQAVTDDLRVSRSRVTGVASFVTAADGGAIAVVGAAGNTQVAAPIDFFATHGALFGVSDAAAELVRVKTKRDALGQVHTTFVQQFKKAPVFSGILKVHQNRRGEIVCVNGDFYPIPKLLDVTPGLSVREAIAIAGASMERDGLAVAKSELVVVDPGWYGDPGIGAHLAYEIVLHDQAAGIEEAFFVDAHKGAILDQWSLTCRARVRSIHDGMGTSDIPGPLARGEGDSATGDFDIDAAYDFYGDTYDYFFRAFGRDSIDGIGLVMRATVHSTAPPCPNAGWSSVSLQMTFCDNTVTDDIVAHELGHGVTQFSGNMIYQNQSGQLNESYSDVWGEMVDLFNGDAAFAGPPSGAPWPTHSTGSGLDTPNNLRAVCSPSPGHVDGVRWLVGEDAVAFGGSIRDMWDPPCAGDPDRANSPLQTCFAPDNGGVHSGSGVPNHAFAMLVDGKSFNGFVVDPIGPIKTGAVWYRALTTYLTVSSDFADAFDSFNQAATDLVGTFPNDPRTGLPIANVFTSADAAAVNNALLAVEMNTDGACGSVPNVLEIGTPATCPMQVTLFEDDFEGGVNGWTVSNSGPPTAYDWVQAGALPRGRVGTAWYCDDPAIGDCAGTSEAGLHSLTSPTIVIPGNVGRPTLSFDHFLETERLWDGGNIRIRVNGGAWVDVDHDAYRFNGPNLTMMAVDQDASAGPLAGMHAWSGAGGSWGTTTLDLSSHVNAGDTVQFRLDFGKDGCGGFGGWWVDDFRLFDCTCGGVGDCDDGLFCTNDACVGGLCVTVGSPCSGADRCDESADICEQNVLFYEGFESGVAAGWNGAGAGSTATTGRWAFGQPELTTAGGGVAQTDIAFVGKNCAFTAQNLNAGRDDVDDGVVYLVSPAIDLTGAVGAEVSYARWFFNRDLGEDIEDGLTVDVSDDDGGSWVNVETLDGNTSEAMWVLRRVPVGGFVGLTGTFRVRFGVSDGTVDGDLIEALIDEVQVGVPVMVACCMTDGNCSVLELVECQNVGGAFVPGIVDCMQLPCVAVPAASTWGLLGLGGLLLLAGRSVFGRVQSEPGV